MKYVRFVEKKYGVLFPRYLLYNSRLKNFLISRPFDGRRVWCLYYVKDGATPKMMTWSACRLSLQLLAEHLVKMEFHKRPLQGIRNYIQKSSFPHGEDGMPRMAPSAIESTAIVGWRASSRNRIPAGVCAAAVEYVRNEGRSVSFTEQDTKCIIIRISHGLSEVDRSES